MLFTTKTEYGLKALVFLAKQKNNQPVSLTTVARATKISQSYLEQIFRRLKGDGIVVSVKGAEGGYLLARKPDKISIFEIVEALEGTIAVFYCMSQSQAFCSVGGCLTKKVWEELQNNIIKTLRKFKLKDII